MRRQSAPIRAGVCLALLLAAGCGERGAASAGGESDAPGVTVAVRSQPAPKPTAPLPKDATCINDECHASLADARQVHRPVADGACHTCHGPDTGTHAFPLLREANETCTYCHAVSGTRTHQHQPVHEDGCLTCHQPHASATKFLLKAVSVERLCAECHDQPWKTYLHGPFANGQCTLCHDPHQADSRALLRTAEGRDHCLTCHSQFDDTRRGMNVRHAPATEGCLSCHDPHTSSFPAHTRAAPAELCVSCHAEVRERADEATFVHGAISSDASCNHCHDPHGSAYTNLLRDREDALCMSCHAQPQTNQAGRTIASMTPTLEQPFLHGPIRVGECSPCHTPHAGNHTALLNEPFPAGFYVDFDPRHYALCFQCHAPELVTTRQTTSLTEFRDDDVNLHFIHVNQPTKGRTCKTCHAVHGSDLPNHMAATVPFEGSRWAMPLGFEKTEHGGRCAPGCHEPKSYERREPSSTALQARGDP
jgi:predicted CXXCH cytochrome family protein